MFTNKELMDLIWTKLLKIMFLLERTHWYSWVDFLERFENFVDS